MVQEGHPYLLENLSHTMENFYFWFAATNSLSELHIKYVTAILESIIQCDCFIVGCFLRGVEHLHKMPHPAFLLHEYQVYYHIATLCNCALRLVHSTGLFCFTISLIIYGGQDKVKEGQSSLLPPLKMPITKAIQLQHYLYIRITDMHACMLHVAKKLMLRLNICYNQLYSYQLALSIYIQLKV